MKDMPGQKTKDDDGEGRKSCAVLALAPERRSHGSAGSYLGLLYHRRVFRRDIADPM